MLHDREMQHDGGARFRELHEERDRNELFADDWKRELKARLLLFGGTSVYFQDPDPWVKNVLDNGMPLRRRVIMRPGAPKRCHANAARVYLLQGPQVCGKPRLRLATGYGLLDGNWLGHSWLLDDDSIIETTVRFDKYFGISLNQTESLVFSTENYGIPEFQEHLAINAAALDSMFGGTPGPEMLAR